jgi:hypothetical protein
MRYGKMIKRRSLKRQLLYEFSIDEGRFPGGDHPTGNCTYCAGLVRGMFGGTIQGYSYADNPTAGYGEWEFGHDFLVVDGFVVDPWLFHYYEQTPVLDTTDPLQMAEVYRRYGRPSLWVSLC